MDTVAIVATTVFLAGCLCLVVMLATLTWLSWGAGRARTAPQKETLRRLGNRLVVALWAVAAVVGAAVLFQESHSASAGLPSLWNPAVTASTYGKALVFLPLGAYLLLGQAIVGLTALTWRLPAFSRKRDQSSDVGTALVSAGSLAAAFLALVNVAAVSYLRLSVQGVPQ